MSMMRNIFITVFLCTGSLHAATALVSPETIAIQKKSTTISELKNGIPVIFRTVEGSDILNVIVTFDHGVKDLPQGKKSYGSLLFSTMSLAANGFPKTKLFQITEKYALELGCSSGIEMSTCALGTLNDHWGQVKDLYGAVIKEPSLSEADLKLEAERNASSIKGTIQNSDRYVNEVVNSVFYEEGHPYRQMPQDSLKELEKVSRDQIIQIHRDVLNAKRMAIVVVGSIDQKKMLSDLETMFGKIAATDYQKVTVKDPKFDAKKSFAMESREIPTAYIRAKFNGLPEGHKDYVAQNLLFKVLDEELGEEIRTKRSLSYSVWGYILQYQIGIGMISASTSKPEETLLAMVQVLKTLKDKPLSAEKLEEYKTVYATKYFLTLETHSSLAGALASTFYAKKSLDPLYDMPTQLAQVTPKDIQRLANQLLGNLRVGVVFDEKNFDRKWGDRFIQATLLSAKKDS